MNGMLTALIRWFDERFPLTATWKRHLSEYYAPKNFNFWYYFGSLALLVLVIQIVTGIFLTMNYKPDATQAFGSVEYIMRDVNWGWLIRYLHSTGASAFFIVVYLHMFRGLMYGSYRKPRELVWLIGMGIYLALMAEAFFGYLLPWGQMSYWGAQVIVNLFSAIPLIGPDLAVWIRGDYAVSDATLNRFFAFHVIALPLALVGLVFVHIVALHDEHVGSNNPDGIEIKKKKGPDGKPLDGIPFHPYYTVKDIMGAVVFLMLFSAVVFFAPEMGGYFLEHNNFIPADPLKTPEHIAPVWYFTPYYSILRATTTDFMWVVGAFTVLLAALIVFSRGSATRKTVTVVVAALLLLGYATLDPKFWGVVLMGVSVLIFALLPWLDKSPVKSIRYKGPIFKLALTLFAVSFLILGYLGVLPPTPGRTLLAQACTVIYFAFFTLMPWYSRMDKTKPEPERVTG
ncbi:cytochrome b [Pelomicrobium sp.]|jgi:ubiquinol-cytochrome c reductase cytochrome b subunit|uniref:cytochrome b n=1 Tax=Pelomicrobium sp. TaxID=2815319 RepID=UPI002FDCF727